MTFSPFSAVLGLLVLAPIGYIVGGPFGGIVAVAISIVGSFHKAKKTN